MKSVRSLEFDLAALDDLTYWVKTDRRRSLLQEIARDPFIGTGRPEH
jgi:Txe/YoeB family toxin of Txe-Axe toxin-antitoxin module